MKINGVLLDLRIAGVKGMLRYFEQLGQLNSAERDVKVVTEDRLMVYKILQLTEEKRRLLTCIVEWMMMVSLKGSVLTAHIKPNLVFLSELQKRVNSAKTMEELAKVGEELAKFKQEYPELEQ